MDCLFLLPFAGRDIMSIGCRFRIQIVGVCIWRFPVGGRAADTVSKQEAALI
jgi:hypothetical protein